MRLPRNLEEIATKTIDSFVNHDRILAIEAIALHKKYQESLSGLRASKGNGLSVGYLDLVYMFERVGRSWEDIVDLVKPIYAKLLAEFFAHGIRHYGAYGL